MSDLKDMVGWVWLALPGWSVLIINLMGLKDA
jgi:hypothetical protein